MYPHPTLDTTEETAVSPPDSRCADSRRATPSITIDQLATKAVALAADLLETAKAQQTSQEKRQAVKIAGMMNDPSGKLMTMALSDQAFRSHDPKRINNQIRHLIEGLSLIHI